MNRPKFLNCPMTPEIIRSIKIRQELYDENPEEYERKEKEKNKEDEEQLRQEQERKHN